MSIDTMNSTGALQRMRPSSHPSLGFLSDCSDTLVEVLATNYAHRNIHQVMLAAGIVPQEEG